MEYKLVCLGGTFDLLHKGHKALLCRAFLVGRKVIIGLANFKKNVNHINKRQKKLVEYLKEKNYFSRAEIVEINDIYGPTVENPDIEAIVVSKKTIKGCLLYTSDAADE